MTTLQKAQERDLGQGSRPMSTVPVGATVIPRLGQTQASPRLRTKVPWIVLADGVSLVIALAAASTRVGLDGSDGRLVLAALVASSLYVWFLFQQFRSLATIIRRRRSGAMAMPVAAAASTAWVLGVGGIALPWTELVLFIVLWSTGLVLGRMALARRQAPLRVLLIGSPRFLRELAGRRDVEVVCLDEPPPRVNGWDIVATDPAEQYDREWLQWISHADMHDIKVISAPLLLETLTHRVPTEMLHGRWALEVLAGSSQYQFWKRLLDVVAVILFAPILLPLAGLVALLVWLDSGRPLLFHQTRMGLGGQPFRMVKFRTMIVDAERNGSAFASCGDARVTRIGAFLRQYRLDEIPQFWNVLKGEMSIIGPRPEQLAFAAQFDEQIPLYQLRHNVRPGITGWAQVKQGYTANSTETEIKLRYDFYYVKHFSFALDASIVWRTVLTILTGFGSR